MSMFPDLPEQVSIERQVKCVERELAFRRRVYARRVEQGKMKHAQAETEIACMSAVLATLERVRASQ